eukprot:748694-Hanusia_phi.AAC.1
MDLAQLSSETRLPLLPPPPSLSSAHHDFSQEPFAMSIMIPLRQLIICRSSYCITRPRPLPPPSPSSLLPAPRTSLLYNPLPHPSSSSLRISSPEQHT